MYQLLEDFWKWLGKTPEEYANCGIDQRNGAEEDNFDGFVELLSFARRVIDKGLTDNSSINDMLTIMALDNESESILEYIEENCSDEQLSMIINMGFSHLQPEARWQLAELIYRMLPENYYSLLLKLTEDKHFYVRKRAKNCIELL
jgi:hypothetical protein